MRLEASKFQTDCSGTTAENWTQM